MLSSLDIHIVELESAMKKSRMQLALLDSSISSLMVNRTRLKRKMKTAQKESEMTDSESVYLVQSWIARISNVESSLKTLKAFRIKTDKELEISVKKLDVLLSKKANIA